MRLCRGFAREDLFQGINSRNEHWTDNQRSNSLGTINCSDLSITVLNFIYVKQRFPISPWGSQPVPRGSQPVPWIYQHVPWGSQPAVTIMSICRNLLIQIIPFSDKNLTCYPEKSDQNRPKSSTSKEAPRVIVTNQPTNQNPCICASFVRLLEQQAGQMDCCTIIPNEYTSLIFILEDYVMIYSKAITA